MTKYFYTFTSFLCLTKPAYCLMRNRLQLCFNRLSDKHFGPELNAEGLMVPSDIEGLIVLSDIDGFIIPSNIEGLITMSKVEGESNPPAVIPRLARPGAT